MGEPIIGATVMVKGVTGGTITDIDGNFSIQGKVGSTLSVTYVGYAPLQVKVTKQEGNRLVMKEDAKVLDEVSGGRYGYTKKKYHYGSCRYIER